MHIGIAHEAVKHGSGSESTIRDTATRWCRYRTRGSHPKQYGSETSNLILRCVVVRL